MNGDRAGRECTCPTGNHWATWHASNCALTKEHPASAAPLPPNWPCPACSGAMPADQMGAPLQAAHAEHAAVAARPAGEDKARPCPSPVCDYPDHGWRPSAPSSPVPDEVREEIARAIAESHPWCEPWDSLSDAPGDTLRNEFRKTADAVLATPALRRAIAERDEARAAVERVRTVLAKAERDAEQSSARMFDGRPFPSSVWHEDLRRALGGDEL